MDALTSKIKPPVSETAKLAAKLAQDKRLTPETQQKWARVAAALDGTLTRKTQAH